MGAIFAVILSVFADVSHRAYAATFAGLGYLPGSSNSQAFAVSADGSIVVGHNFFSPGSQAFVWTANNGMEPIGPRQTSLAFAHGVSADGKIVVGQSDTTRAYRWQKTTGIVSLKGGQAAYGISADGSIVVGQASDQPAYWDATGNLTLLGGFPGQPIPVGNTSSARAVSADGSVIVGWSGVSLGSGFDSQAFRWTKQDGMISLGSIGNNWFSRAFDVSADGSVIVGDTRFRGGNFPRQAMLWTAERGMIGLGTLPGTNDATALAISGDGSIVVGKSSKYAFIWDQTHGMRNLQSALLEDYGLDTTGWQLTEAKDVSFDGSTIVGIGINPSGNIEAWTANIAAVPLPKSAWLFGFTIITLASFTRSQRRFTSRIEVGSVLWGGSSAGLKT